MVTTLLFVLFLAPFDEVLPVRVIGGLLVLFEGFLLALPEATRLDSPEEVLLGPLAGSLRASLEEALLGSLASSLWASTGKDLLGSSAVVLRALTEGFLLGPSAGILRDSSEGFLCV